MNNTVRTIISAIKNEYDLNAPTWNELVYTLIARSGPTPSFQLEQSVWDENNNRIDAQIAWLNNVSNEKEQLFKDQNKKDRANKISFIFKNHECVEIQTSWDQTVQDKFEELLPPSQKGKVNAWYLPVNGDSTLQQPIEYPSTTMLKRHLTQLPIDEAPIPSHEFEGKLLPELYKLYEPYIRDSTTPLWDGGMITIRKKEDGSFTGELMEYYYDSEELRTSGRANYSQAQLPVITKRMRSIYEAIKCEGKKQFPSVDWNTIFISLYRDGGIEPYFELDGVEVFLKKAFY